MKPIRFSGQNQKAQHQMLCFCNVHLLSMLPAIYSNMIFQLTLDGR